MNNMVNDDQLDAVFSALANPYRRAILARLAKGTATVNDIAVPFDVTLPAISQHIRVLEAAGLVTRTREAQFRPCALDTKPLQDIASWTDQYRAIWEGRFDSMDLIIRQMKEDENG